MPLHDTHNGERISRHLINKSMCVYWGVCSTLSFTVVWNLKSWRILVKWPWTEMKVAQSSPTLCDPMDYTVQRILQARILDWVAFPFSRGSSQPMDQIAGGFFTSWTTREALRLLPNPGTEPRSPILQAYSLPAEPPGKPKTTRVGTLSLLQGIFLTQELNQGLLHCRGILYQLSYQGSL